MGTFNTVINVYGLKTCDSCRKAQAWLKEEGLGFRFLDLRADGIDRTTLKNVAAKLGWEKILNKASTTWRALSDAEKDGVDEARALRLMTAHPALIKRPVFEAGHDFIVGFRDADRAKLKTFLKAHSR